MSELEGDILEKDALDEEICRAAQKQRQGTAQNVSPPSECTVPSDGDESDNNQSLAFAKSPFFKSKGKNKTPLASTPVLKRRETDVEKSYQESAPLMQQKGHRKKAPKRRENPDLQEDPRYEAFMEWMVEAEREYRKDQEKFSMDALLCSETSSRALVKKTNEHPFLVLFSIFIVVFCCHEIVDPLLQNHLLIS